MKRLSVIVPCYNESESLPLFWAEMQKIEERLSFALQFEYWFIDDGSSDATLPFLRQLAQGEKKVHYLALSRNFGKEAALLAGLEACQGELVTVMDADLQDPPSLLLSLYEKLQEGYDVVGTRRRDRRGEPLLRSAFAKLFYWLINQMSGTEMVDGVRDFRLMTRQVVDSILALGEVNRFSKGIFSWVGYRTTYIAYDNHERVAGKTSWHFWQLLKYSLDGFINFSEVPLNLAIWAGTGAFLTSLLGILFVVVRRLLFGDPVAGWASLVSIILFIGGIQLLCLGIIGKYIAKIFLETKKRPVYIVKEKG